MVQVSMLKVNLYTWWGNVEVIFYTWWKTSFMEQVSMLKVTYYTWWKNILHGTSFYVVFGKNVEVKCDTWYILHVCVRPIQ